MSATPTFAAYASFYDALYRDKDYAGECDDLERIFGRFAASPVRQLLDLGCGTGGHAIILASRGYRVTGVDRSAQMLEIARAKGQGQGVAIKFEEGDIRTWRAARTWDAAIAMFAVVSYQVDHADVAAVIENARRHLAPRGLFIFDVWFGAGIVNDPPGERTKRAQDHGHDIIRHASSELDLPRQTVDVHYSITDVNGQGTVRRVRETHRMRFFFPNELELLLSAGGFRLVHLCPFGFLDEPVRRDTWNATVVAQAT
jgi:SAM-dependent methyltransferase